MSKIKNQNLEPCDIIFNYVDKPDSFLMCKNTNVFDDKWRVNIYSRRYVDGIEGKCISGSYFVKYNQDDQSIKILSHSNK
jgi:hypothetical protein